MASWLASAERTKSEAENLLAEFRAFREDDGPIAVLGPHPNIDRVNSYAAKSAIAGWFIGLAYYNWFASNPPHAALWGHLLLVTVGMFTASFVIGGGVSLLAALVTKRVTGRRDSSPEFFAWGAFISPVLTFFAADHVLQCVGLISR